MIPFTHTAPIPKTYNLALDVAWHYSTVGLVSHLWWGRGTIPGSVNTALAWAMNSRNIMILKVTTWKLKQKVYYFFLKIGRVWNSFTFPISYPTSFVTQSICNQEVILHILVITFWTLLTWPPHSLHTGWPHRSSGCKRTHRGLFEIRAL